MDPVKQIEDIMKGVSAIKEKLNSHDEKLNTVEDVKKSFDGLDFEMLKKASEDVAKMTEESQKTQLKQKEVEKEIAELKKELYRVPNGGASENEIFKKYRNAYKDYLYKGVDISKEICEEFQKSCVQRDYADEPEWRQEEVLRGVKSNINSLKGDYLGADFSLVKNGWLGGQTVGTKELVGGINPQGGYWLQPERRTDITVDQMFETSPIRSVARVINTVNREIEIIVDDNESISGGWVGETETRPETGTADIGQLSIFAHEQFAQPTATRNMLDDAGFDLEAWVQSKSRDIMTRTENTAFVSGDGSKKPKGFLSFPAWSSPGVYERSAIEQRNSGSNGNFTFDSIVKLQNDLKEVYQPRSVFLTKRASFSDILLLKDLEGRSLWDFELLRQGAQLSLLGKPVMFADDMQAVATDALALIYGDFSVGYTIVDRLGFTLIRDELTLKPFIKFYTIKRVGGTVTNFESLKLLKLTA